MNTKALWLGLCLSVSSGGCSLITAISTCEGPADCDTAAGETCSVEKYCVPAGAATCSPASCLAERGMGYVCGVGNECVQATTANCARIIGPIDDPDAIILGSILPLSNGFEGLGGPIEQGVDLAVREINEAGGIGDGRPLVVISCDDGANLEQAKAAARHLAQVVGTPAIVGPAFSGIYLQVVRDITKPAGVMTMSPSATSPLISDLEDSGLAWRTAASDQFQGVAMGDLIATRPTLRRIVALAKDDAYGKGLLDAVSLRLVELLGADNFKARLYPDPAVVMSPDYVGAVSDVLGQLPRPDAVILFGTTESIDVMQIAEQQLSGTSSRTEYLFADGGKLPDMLAAIDESPSLERRVSGTEADHQFGQTYTKFGLRLSQTFGNVPGIYAANAYDAVYVLASAAMTVTSGKPTGALLAAGVAKLVDGRSIEVGPTDLGLARSLLSAGGSVDLKGASGPLDFDLARGEAPANVALWRVRENPNAPMEYRFESGGTYEVMGASGQWTFR